VRRFAFLLACCVPAAKDANGVALSKYEMPPGISLQTACTPSGPELCFNAIDDNCNGVIDEGCGLNSGALQFVIAWSEANADVDISVTDPAGVTVGANNRRTPSGLSLDRDCPSSQKGDQCHGQNVENIFFEGSEPPRGRYKVEVVLSEVCLKNGQNCAQAPVSVQLGARIGSRSYSAQMSLGNHDKKTFTFEL